MKITEFMFLVKNDFSNKKNWVFQNYNHFMSEKEIEINDQNFHEYFFDVRKFGPKPGQVLAKFSAIAEFVEGGEKRDIIMLLKKDKAQQASLIMRKLHGAKEPDCYRICREISEDLLTMSDEEVEKKVYQYTFEMFYYTQKELVPKNKHWETINLLEYDEEKQAFVSRIEI